MIQEINIDQLIPHPGNCNHMNAEKLEKLKKHIGFSGRYEPLTVRPHPTEAGKFQIINGHNRFLVLKSLGCESVLCGVWNVNDIQVGIYLATLNRLCGSDVPERRALLIEDMLGDFSVDELESLLPDGRELIQELQRLSASTQDAISRMETPTVEDVKLPCILSFMLDESDASEINSAIDLVLTGSEQHITRGKALVEIAKFYARAHGMAQRAPEI